MIGHVLVVDDIELNVKSLTARLEREYYTVDKAFDGPQALSLAISGKPDIILLDVMMPGMNGTEVCRRLKADPETHDIPVIMVTALDGSLDRIAAFDAGADDFLTKPIDDLTLFARIRNLLQLKMITDELKAGVAGRNVPPYFFGQTEDEPSHILLIDDWASSRKKVADAVGMEYELVCAETISDGLDKARMGRWDLIISNLSPQNYDGLRLCAQLRMGSPQRAVPLLVIADIDDKALLSRAFDLGADDHIPSPLDTHEILVRVRTQIRKSRRQRALRRLMREELDMALTDPLTGIGNRRHFDSQISSRMMHKRENVPATALVIIDIDHFKTINDTYGHPSGDRVLEEIAARLRNSIRTSDFLARIGGEEFAVLLPTASAEGALVGAERLRKSIEAAPFRIESGQIPVTASLGVGLAADGETSEALYARVDRALYAAKNGGRNRSVMAQPA